MMIEERIIAIRQELPPDVKLVAVSKFHPVEAIREAYAAGQRVFGENRPQEFFRKVQEVAAWKVHEVPRNEVEWHFIGHLQTNKLKLVLPYAQLVQSVDSQHLLDAIQDWGKANGRVVNVLLELHIGAEQTKTGFKEEEVLDILFRADKYKNVRFCGLMGMATHTDSEADIRADFARIADFRAYLQDLFPELTDFRELSIGMSGDWRIALDYGATIVRIGTAIFGERQY
ncbi:MAG: YggS family pyridoxal phosphate-dependent enzyme [Bacteroidales bacterium]|nr:YggS family pyridoxal phosphate-dependent enzyme [Bacteroidales bacterium]